MTNQEKWQRGILFAVLLVIAGALAAFFYQEWQRERRIEQARREFDWNKVKYVPMAESEMLLNEGGVLDGINALRQTQVNLPEPWLGNEERFGYVTVVKARFGSEITYVVSFSKEKPNALLDQYDGRTNMVQFRWPESSDASHFWLHNKDCSWVREVYGGMGFSFSSPGHDVSFRSLELKKIRPLLFTKF